MLNNNNLGCQNHRATWVFVPVLLLFIFGYGNAQQELACDDIVLSEAQKHYQVGHFDELINGMQGCLINGFTDRQKVEAYRLLAMTYLALDSTHLATVATEQLLVIDPAFQASLLDPPQFIALVDRLRVSVIRSDMVTSVSKKEEDRLLAPATVMVVTQDDIKNRGYIDLEELFSDLPGFDISRTVGLTYSHIYQRGYRSLSTERTLFLIDGVEENELWTNIAYWSRQYPISNVKRVEVIYGPASTMYGANALVGVVNVITKDPVDITGNRSVGVSFNAGGGTYKTGYGDLTVAAKYKSISFSSTVRKFNSDEMDWSKYKEYNYDPSDYETENASLIYRKNLRIDSATFKDLIALDSINTRNYYSVDTTNRDVALLTEKGVEAVRALDQKSLSQYVNGKPIGYSNTTDQMYISARLRVADLLVRYETWRSEQGSNNFYNDNMRAGAKNGTKWVPLSTTLYAQYDKILNDRISFMNIAQYRQTSLDNETKQVTINNYYNGQLKAESLVQGIVPTWTFYRSYELAKQFRNEAKLIASPGKVLDIIGGLEFRSSSLYGDYRKTTQATGYISEIGKSPTDTMPGGGIFDIIDLGAYGQGTFKPVEILRLTFAGRFDYNQIRVTGGYGLQFNPRAALVFTPGNFILKGIYSSAFQNASNFTKYATTAQRKLNNPTLEPEKVNNFEASAGYKLTQNSYVDIVYYYAIYDGAIGTKVVNYGTGTTEQNEALGASKIQGVQASANVSFENYSLYANYTYTNPQNEILDKSGALTGLYQRVGSIATNHVNLGVNALYFDRINVNLRTQVVGRIPVGKGTTVADNPDSVRMFPAYAVLNGTVGWYNILPGLDIQFICNNILNKEYVHPGIRTADGISYGYRAPQRGRVFLGRLVYNLK